MAIRQHGSEGVCVMSSVTTGFNPLLHGFHFTNNFTNTVLSTPFGDITTSGRCGGMSFAALDYFYAHMTIPGHMDYDFGPTQTPADGKPLPDYIYKREMDLIVSDGLRFFEWTERPDHHTWVRDGVTELTKNEEFPKLMATLANGPVPIALIVATSILHIGDNHVIVASGAEFDESSGTMMVHGYDCRNPNEAVTLTSTADDPHFILTIDRYTDPSEVWRGWFVANYSAITPTYVDLAISHPLMVNPSDPGVGDPLDSTFTVRNYGDYPSHVAGLWVEADVPPSDTATVKFASTSVNGSLNVGAELSYAQNSTCFAKAQGSYTLRPVCRPLQAYTLGVPLPTALSAGAATVFVPTPDLVLNVRGISDRVTATPPHVASAEVTAIKSGQTDSLAECERPRLKYRAEWKDAPLEFRTLDVFSQPIVPNADKKLMFDITFATLGAMRPDKVKLTLDGKAPDGTTIHAVVPLTGTDTEFIGTWTPPALATGECTIRLTIEGADNTPRYFWRTPKGDVLDGLPQTVARVNTSQSGYPFEGYEPGPDSSYSIVISARNQQLTPDRLEPNDTPKDARLVALKNAAILDGAWAHFDDLNFHSATDVDMFHLHYEPLPGDDTCALDAPVEEDVSGQLGLSLTRYPPSLVIEADGHGSCVDLALSVDGARKSRPWRSVRKVGSFVLYNPTRVFANRSVFVAFKNTSFAFQGAFGYSAAFGYLPAHTVWSVDSNAPAYRARGDIRRRLLKRYFDAIDLPRPGGELLNRSTGESYPYPATSVIVDDMQKSIQCTRAFLSDPATRSDLKAISPGKEDAILAEARKGLAEIAASAGLISDAAGLLRTSARGFEKANMKREQVKVLKRLTSL